MVRRPGWTFVLGLWLVMGKAASAEVAAASAPASQPAEEMVLVRIGDRITITQADFEHVVGSNPAAGDRMRDAVLLGMVEDRLLLLYAQDHPELVSPADVDAKIAQQVQAAGLESVDSVRKEYEKRGEDWEQYRRSVLIGLVRAKFADRGAALISDKAKLKEIFEARKSEFDGSTVRARQIYFFVPVYATDQEREAVRNRLEKMREDILSGKRTWEECVKESDSAVLDGDLGPFHRHLQQPEFVAEEAFKLQPGQLTPVIQSPVGYHLVQVMERNPPPQTTYESLEEIMKHWLEQEDLFHAMQEVRAKYRVVGVQPPRYPASRPAPEPLQVTTRPTSKRKPVFWGDRPTRPTTQTAPATRPTK